MDFLACLASAVHFEVILFLNIFEVKKVRAAVSICLGLEKEKAFSIALGKWIKKIYMFWKIKKTTNIAFNSVIYRQFHV